MSIVRAAEVVVLLCIVYIACGLTFAPLFVWRGVGRIDPAARSAGTGFRLVILPGVAALWPVLLRRWLAGSLPPVEQNAHREAAPARDARGRSAALDDPPNRCGVRAGDAGSPLGNQGDPG